MKGTTDSIIIFHYFPVPIDWMLRLAAAVVHDSLPHLETENSEGENEKCVQNENIAEL